jgi:iron complex transport system ATP-binding protein
VTATTAATNTVEVAATALLRATGVSASLDGQPVLHEVSLSVAAGEGVGLIGPNGAGKSTFVRAATALVPLTAGSIEVDGHPLAALRQRELARLVAVVQQLPEAPATMRVAELVLLGRNPHLGLLARESARDFAAAAAAMRRAGCEAFADRPLGTLSGGERRRAFIARALAQEPRLLLLDEPTANLDVEAQCETFELLRTLAADGVGVLVVAHDLTLAAAYCDRLVLLARGRVVATGTPAEVLTAANVAHVYGDRVAVVTSPQHRVPLVVPAILEARHD